MNFCSQCGARLSLRIPPGDHLPRYVCDHCHAVHYQNPKLVAGCIPAWEGRILLCRRAIEPRLGLWTIPAGFMENGETTAQAAAREAREEANADVEVGPLYALYDLPGYSQVYLIFLARLRAPEFSPGEESLETRLFAPDEIPWDDLAFLAVRQSLRQYVAETRHGHFRFHMGNIHASGDGGHAITPCAALTGERQPASK